MQTTYLSAADTAKLIRAALKKAFPGVTFSVKSKTYSGGASINVAWTDGPTQPMVEAIAKNYQGGGFDGMIDMKWHRESWLLPDGTATHASTEGTEGSRGTVPAKRVWMPHPDAKLVSFGADFVFCNRTLSPAFEAQLFARLARKGYPVEGIQSMDDAWKVRAYPDSDWDRTDMGEVARREAARMMIARG